MKLKVAQEFDACSTSELCPGVAKPESQTGATEETRVSQCLGTETLVPVATNEEAEEVALATLSTWSTYKGGE
ncbi:hypothetical protein V6N12_010536 [Hibiscus sabdariffa]|uniref:Uncharacterized protein n=1 Tax=Hibiscus sabdariffa TaxID=183260 RepID=A0ABR2ELX0_9ROSI